MFVGLKRGLELIRSFLRAFYHANKTDNAALMVALLQVARTWHKELTGVAIETKHADVQIVVTALIFGRDPFSGSRAQLQAVLETWPDAR